MFRIKEFYNKYLSKISGYGAVIIGFIVLSFVIEDSSPYTLHIYGKKINALEKEIEQYRAEIEVNRKKLENLRTNKEGLERFAREEYLMKKPNEDLFIIKE
jgi:cell division protein FtsB